MASPEYSLRIRANLPVRKYVGEHRLLQVPYSSPAGSQPSTNMAYAIDERRTTYKMVPADGPTLRAGPPLNHGVSSLMDAKSAPVPVPIGLAHIGFLAAASKANRDLSEPFLQANKAHLSVLGTAMAGLYISATCHRGCRGGDHMIEALGARIYNLACGAYALASIGLYDEALNLVRSIGEIANLLSLSISEKEKFAEWAASSKPDRIKNFGPAKVRAMLEKSGIVIMNHEWYSELCESYTHITPQTSPNKYDLGRNVCGGIIQPAGAKKVIEQLTNLVAVVSLYFCRYSGVDDVFETLSIEFRKLRES